MARGSGHGPAQGRQPVFGVCGHWLKTSIAGRSSWGPRWLPTPFLMNFLHGRISRTGLKAVCVPGLNCYSCPAAAASCPIWGASGGDRLLQVPVCMVCGGIPHFRRRAAGAGGVCGFLCPFGWFQELLHKIPAKKVQHQAGPHLDLSEIRDSGALRHCPAYNGGQRGGNGRPVLLQVYLPRRHPGGRHPAGAGRCRHPGRPGLDYLPGRAASCWGTALLAVFFYRPFCKWLCPLGAFYGLCNRISICRLQVDSGRCTACGACSHACRMDVDVFKTPNHAECIRCGDCAAACPHGAITRVFSIKTIQEKKETAT